MTASGYIRKGEPDPSWWMQQIHAGIDFRKKFANQEAWERWRSYYRGKWRPDVMPVNLFFTMMRTIVPRVYFRNPSVSITPGMPGLEAMAFAKILERVDNKLLETMQFKQHAKRAVQHSFQFGTGVLKLGFGAQYTPTPNFGFTSEPVARDGSRVEYRDRIFPQMPWAGAVHTKDFIVPDQTMVYQDARWVAHWVRRPTDEIKADKRLSHTKDIGSTSKSTLQFGTLRQTIEMTDLIEIRDKREQKVIVISPMTDRHSQVLLAQDDVLQAYGSIPYYPIVFNEDDEVFWGTPDSQILEPYQLEINEIKTQSMKHRRMALVKILAKIKSITEEEAQKLVSEDVGGVIFMSGDPKTDIMQMQISNIPQDLIVAGRELMQDVRETIGFSRNQFGEFNSRSGDTTATEAQIVRQASEIRVDERRDTVADAIVNFIQDMHAILFNHWTTEQVVEVVGPGGVPIWVRFKGEDFRRGGGKYSVKVDPDSSVPDTKQVREQRSLGLYNVLKTNPLIDPHKLTQYLLHELHGTQFDDMMRMLPPVENAPAGPVGVPQFASMIQQSAQRTPLQMIQGGQSGA